MKTPIRLSNYEIRFGSAELLLKDFLSERAYSKLICLVDSNTEVHCLPLLADIYQQHLIQIPAGEAYKHIDQCKDIWTALTELDADRKSLLINLGGGVIGDMGGFVASTFKRGIDFIQIPTTLLAQVDASIGGKLGVDHDGHKNAVGLFKDPQTVIVDVAFLETLPQEQLKSGYAEVLKHGLIRSEKIWKEAAQTDPIVRKEWDQLIFDAIQVKRRVVSDDPYESGLRKILNFGHTIGHGIESYYLQQGSPMLHGYAVAIGMICEAYIATKLTGLPVQKLEEITKVLLKHYGHHPIRESAFDPILAFVQKDKKNKGREIMASLITDIGDCMYNIHTPPTYISQALQYYNLQS